MRSDFSKKNLTVEILQKSWPSSVVIGALDFIEK